MRRQLGFTLIEVLIAVTIVSIAITGLISAAMNYTFQQSKIRDSSYAIWIARNVMNQAQLGTLAGAAGKTQLMQLRAEWHIKRENTEDQFTDKLIVTVNNLEGDRLTTLTGFIANKHANE